MAYINQEDKARLTPAIKAVLKKYNVKGSISIRHHSVLVVKLKSGSVDFGTDYQNVNHYHIESHYKNLPIAKQFLLELKSAMMQGNHDNSDAMTDYFDVGWYIDIKVGDYDTPYVVV